MYRRSHLQVNGVQLQNLTHDEIVEEFKKAGKKVTLVLDTGAEMRIVTVGECIFQNKRIT